MHLKILWNKLVLNGITLATFQPWISHDSFQIIQLIV